MTLMVRDEADIVAAMLDHHRAQGVDHVIVTDNGSVDGTTEILESFARQGFVTLWHDPEYRKQQWSVVTRMARHAAEQELADWVINADADEFWIPTDDQTTLRTLRTVLESVGADIPYLNVPVINLTGAPAKDGTGTGRLRYRDRRTEEELHAAGIPFHPTADALHRAHPLVEISQGNHFVSAPGWGAGHDSAQLEVLHLPWRSWRQYQHKVRASGEAYMSNPELSPSPRHHGMQDFRRLQGNRLEPTYVAKHPLPEEIDRMLVAGSLQIDDRLSGLSGSAGMRADIPYSEDESVQLASIGRQFTALESETEDRLQRLIAEQAYERSLWVAGREGLQAEIDRLAGELDRTRGRFVVRATDRLASIGRSARSRITR